MGTIMERVHTYPARCLVSEYQESAIESITNASGVRSLLRAVG